MRIFLMLFSFFAALSPLSGYEIQEIDSFNEIATQFEAAGKGTLVLFDVDNVLTIPSHPAFQIANWAEHMQIVGSHYYSLSLAEQEALVMLMVTQNPLILIESSAPGWIATLQEGGATVMALTAYWSGGDLAEQRLSVLRSLGMEFSGSGRAVFDQFPLHNGSHPLYSDGVLFTNGKSVEKGNLLEAFFVARGSRPDRVCFIDDHKNNLESVGETMDRLGIPCDLYWYHGAKRFESEVIDPDEMESVWSAYTQRAKEIAP